MTLDRKSAVLFDLGKSEEITMAVKPADEAFMSTFGTQLCPTGRGSDDTLLVSRQNKHLASFSPGDEDAFNGICF